MCYNESIVASASMLGTRAGLPVYIPPPDGSKRFCKQPPVACRISTQISSYLKNTLPHHTYPPTHYARGCYAMAYGAREFREDPRPAETSSRRSVRRWQRARARHADRRSLDRTQVDKDLVR